MSAFGCVNLVSRTIDQVAAAAANAKRLGDAGAGITHSGVMDVFRDVGTASGSLKAARASSAIVDPLGSELVSERAAASLIRATRWIAGAEAQMARVHNMSTFGKAGPDSAQIGAEATETGRVFMRAAANALKDAQKALEELLPPGAQAASAVPESSWGWIG